MRPSLPAVIEVLVVDDSAVVRQLLTTLLTSESGIHVTTASDPVVAMAKMRRRRPHVILLDLEMPRMNGLEVLAAVKEHPDWRRIPVVMMTSSSKEEHVLTAYGRHANCYVTKPVDLDEFVEAVRSIEEFWLSLVRLPAA